MMPRHNTAVRMGKTLVAGVYGCRPVDTCSSETQWRLIQKEKWEGYTVCLVGLTTSPTALQHKVGYTRMGHWCCTPCSHSHLSQAKIASSLCSRSTSCMRTQHWLHLTHPQWGPCNEGVHTRRTVAYGYQIGLKVLTCKGHVSARLGGAGERSQRARSPCSLWGRIGRLFSWSACGGRRRPPACRARGFVSSAASGMPHSAWTWNAP